MTVQNHNFQAAFLKFENVLYPDGSCESRPKEVHFDVFFILLSSREGNGFGTFKNTTVIHFFEILKMFYLDLMRSVLRSVLRSVTFSG